MYHLCQLKGSISKYFQIKIVVVYPRCFWFLEISIEGLNYFSFYHGLISNIM
jgi:hypothetical protein